MSDVPGSSPGSEGGRTPAPSVASGDAGVLASLEHMLAAEEAPPPRQPRRPNGQYAADAADTQDSPATADTAPDASDEAPASGTEEDDEGTEPAEPEEDARPAIDPPHSWNAADREVFSRAPPDVQEVFARRQNEADRYFQQRTQQVAEESRAIATARMQEQQEYAANLQKLLFVASPEAGKYAQIDWQRLAVEQPAEYVRLSAERDGLRNRIGELQNELQRVQYAAQQQQAIETAKIREEQLHLLTERMPVFKDPVKGPQMARDIGDWLIKRGFSPEEVGQVYDARVLEVVAVAMQADRAAATRKAVVADRQPAPSVQPSGTKQRSDRTAAQRRDAKMAALRKSGSQQDALEYLKEIL